MKHLLFVYGTLKKGFGLAKTLASSEFLGERFTLPQWQLVSLGSFPGMVPGTLSVQGELYKVDDETLKRLDFVEGHPTFYQRTLIVLKDGEMAEAYVYQGTGDMLARGFDSWGEFGGVRLQNLK